ncbi:DUF58 domain-containing protein [Porticoccaceae bacterium LTM1]|nr:DUF58 domain-containing protein [Porticoccaceae bacterium LTM1]
MSTALTFDELFDPEFLSSLGHLSITARRVAGGGRFGEKLSKDLGSGLEFKDFRPYSAGDDLRRIDWNIYNRLGRIFLRLYEEQQDLPLYLMPDLSESMYSEGAVRAKAALRASLAMATISMNQNDSAGLVPFGEDMEVITKGKSGKANIMSFARHLSGLKPQAKTDLPKSLQKLSSLNLRSGLLVIVSDFFDPAGLEAIKKALGKVKHKVLLIQIVRPSDSDPTLQGELRLRDCETGEVADIAMTTAVLKRYQEAYQTFSEQLAQVAKKRQAGLLRLDAEGDVVGQLAKLFETGSLHV